MEPVGPDRWQEAVQQLLDVRRPQQAEQLVRRRLAEYPQEAFAHVLLAVVLVRQQHYPPAARAAQQAIALDPQLADGHYLLSVTQLQAGQSFAALGCIREALRLDAYNVTYHGYEAVIYNTRREPELALRAAETGLAIDPTDLECLFQRILALRKLQRFRSVAVGIAQFAQHYPGHSLTHRLLGEVARRDMQPLVAETHFREALRLAPDDKASQKQLAELVLDRGEQALQQNAAIDAIACFEEALRLDPALPDAQRLLRQATNTTLWWHKPMAWSRHWKARMQSRRFGLLYPDKLLLIGQALIYGLLLPLLLIWHLFSFILDCRHRQQMVAPTPVDGWFFGGLIWGGFAVVSALLLPPWPPLIWLLVSGGLVFPLRNFWLRVRQGAGRFPLGFTLLLSPGGNALLKAYGKLGATNAEADCRGFLAIFGAFLLVYQLFRPVNRP